MKKLTRKSLDELAQMLPAIGRVHQKGYVGGGNGTMSDPYTVSEYNYMYFHDTWHGGYVAGMSYVLQSGYIASGNSYTGNTGSANMSSFAAQLAADYLGINETHHSKVIEEWQRNQIGNLGYTISASDTSWCAIFVAEVYHEVGISHLVGAQARVDSWRNWGQGVTTPRPGDVAIYNKGSHMGIVESVNADGTVTVICGNNNGNGSPGEVQRVENVPIGSLTIRRAS